MHASSAMEAYVHFVLDASCRGDKILNRNCLRRKIVIRSCLANSANAVVALDGTGDVSAVGVRTFLNPRRME